MEVFSGTLDVKISGLFQTKTYTQVWCVLYCGVSNISPHIDLYETRKDVNFSSSSSLCKKTIELRDTHWKKPVSPDPVFGLDVKGKHILFFTGSQKERSDWINALCSVDGELLTTRHIVGGLDMASCHYPKNDSTEEVFQVLADDKKGDSSRCGLSGTYLLKLGETAVDLLDSCDKHLIYSWEYVFMSKYGWQNDSFYIQAGTRCTSGKGTFYFVTEAAETVTKCVDVHTNKIRMAQQKLHNVSENTGRRTGDSAVKVLPVERSLSGQSSLSANKKGTEKANKKLLKEQQKKEKEQKKLEEAQRKKEQKELEARAKEEKKMKAKEKKNDKSKKKDKAEASISKSENHVSESASDSTSRIQISGFQENEYATAGDDYAEVGVVSPVPPQTGNNAPESQIYAEPWEGKKISPLYLPTPNQTESTYSNDNEITDVYAMVVKTPKKKETIEGREVLHSQNYEPVDLGDGPSIVPPKWNSQEDESNNNLYDHFRSTQQRQPQPENVYGSASGRPLESQSGNHDYETTYNN